ncbi:MAG TPA: hypothetical protein VJC18_02070, partial [bacterium]|nr:hypothetical protein [bacterium]
EDFDETTSFAACQMFNMTKTAISQASLGDQMLCHIQNGLEFEATKEGVDIADGKSHVLALDFSQDPYQEDEGKGMPDLIRIKIEKNAEGAITFFEMAACAGDEQAMFVSQQVEASQFEMKAINIGSGEDMQYQDSVIVTGTLNADGFFVDEVDGEETPKLIEMQHKSKGAGASEGSFDFWGNLIFKQFSDLAMMKGQMSGANKWEDEGCEFTDQIVAHMDLIDGNGEAIAKEDYQISLLELGDGALLGMSSGGCGDKTWEHEYTEAWTGADALVLEPYTDSGHYNIIKDQALPESSSPDISFVEDQIFDCSSTPEATLVFGAGGGGSQAKQLTAGEEPKSGEMCQNFMLNHEYIDCWHQVEEVKEDLEQGGGGKFGEGEPLDLAVCGGEPDESDSISEKETVDALCECFEWDEETCTSKIDECKDAEGVVTAGDCVDYINGEGGDDPA